MSLRQFADLSVWNMRHQRALRLQLPFNDPTS
jgi:hypothetical protein